MFRSVIYRLGLRYISRRMFQSVLFIIGVALGVAVMIAIDLANDSASRAFDLSTESITGRATHQITGGPGGLPTSLYRTVRVDLGIKDSAPVILESLRVEEFGDRPFRLLGVDPFAEPPFRSYLAAVDVTGEEQDAFEALNRFIAEPGTVLLSETTAARFGKQTGDTLTLRAGTQTATVKIIGLLRPDDQVSQQALDDLMLTDIATAQETTGRPGFISRIDLILPDEYDITQIESVLPEGALLINRRGGDNALQQLTAAFEINLQALSLLALVVGVFLIYNTVTFSVVQRRPVIGIMRSIGMTKRQIFAFILGEAFVLGLAGTLLGIGLGIIFGRLTVGLVSQTITDLYFTVNVQSITVEPFTLVKGAAVGLAASIGAAVIPAYDATRTQPAGTMRRSQFEEQTRKLVPYITGAAVALCVGGFLLLQIPTQNIIISFVALFAVIVGGAFFTPILLLAGMRASTPVTGRFFGVLGRMAPRAITRSLSRTSIAVAALTIAVSVIVGVSVMIGSFRGTVNDWLLNSLGADVFISPPLLNSNRPMVDVDPLAREIVLETEGIARVSAARTVSVTAPDYPDMPPANLLASHFDIAEEKRRFAWTTVPAEDHQGALDDGQIMVSEPFAYRRGIDPANNTLTLLTDQGEQTFTVFGVYYDYSTDQGTVYMSRATYDRYFDDPFISSMGAFLEPGADVNEVMERLRTRLADYDLQIQSNRDLREGALEVFDRTFTITVALQLLATLVAFIGILSALMALQLEHTREYGVMRANGMTPRQLWQYTLIQTGLMGTIAGILALPIGLVLAWVLIYVINVRSFGWTMQLSLTADEFIVAFLVAVVAALLAGLYPAWQISRLMPATALRRE